MGGLLVGSFGGKVGFVTGTDMGEGTSGEHNSFLQLLHLLLKRNPHCLCYDYLMFASRIFSPDL